MARYCCITGKRESLWGWFRRLIRHSNFVYMAEKEGDDYFSVWRNPAHSDRSDIREVLCEGGHWTVETSNAPRYSIFSDRAADDYVRRLNNGIPQNYEIVLTLMGGSFLVASLVVEVIF